MATAAAVAADVVGCHAEECAAQMAQQFHQQSVRKRKDNPVENNLQIIILILICCVDILPIENYPGREREKKREKDEKREKK